MPRDLEFKTATAERISAGSPSRQPPPSPLLTANAETKSESVSRLISLAVSVALRLACIWCKDESRRRTRDRYIYSFSCLCSCLSSAAVPFLKSSSHTRLNFSFAAIAPSSLSLFDSWRLALSLSLSHADRRGTKFDYDVRPIRRESAMHLLLLLRLPSCSSRSSNADDAARTDDRMSSGMLLLPQPLPPRRCHWQSTRRRPRIREDRTVQAKAERSCGRSEWRDRNQRRGENKFPFAPQNPGKKESR